MVSQIISQLKRRSETYGLLAPVIAWFSIFFIIPLVFILIYSFFKYSSFNVIREFTLNGYIEHVFTSSAVSVLIGSVEIGCAVTILALLFGYPVAYYLRFHMGEYTGFILLTLLVVVFYISLVVRSMSWFVILGKGGIINKLLLGAGLIDQPLGWLLFTPVSQIIAFLENLLVFMIASIYVSLSQIDEGIIEASETLRGTPTATFRYVIWPLSRPGVAIGSIFVYVLSTGNFIIPQILGGGSSSITSLIYSQFSPTLNYPAAAALSITLMVVLFVPAYVVLRTVDITDIASV